MFYNQVHKKKIGAKNERLRGQGDLKIVRFLFNFILNAIQKHAICIMA